MNGILGFFGKIFKSVAGLMAVLVLVGGFIFGCIGYFSLPRALIGLVVAFVIDVIVFGFIGMIAEVNAKLDMIQGISRPSASEPAKTQEESVMPKKKSELEKSPYVSAVSNGDGTWTCKKCGCATNPDTSSTCKDCGEYK